MKLDDIKKVTVIGAGTMGSGIAQVFAATGYEVNSVEVRQDLLDQELSMIEKSLMRLVKKGKITGGKFYLSIADNGPGLGRAERTQIFEEIRRFGGVGLHIVRRLLTKYDAKLVADDRIQGYPKEGLKIMVIFNILKE